MGPPMVRMERELGVAPPTSTVPIFRPHPEDDAARAERLRLARQAQQAREATVFFKISARREAADAPAQPAPTQLSPDSHPGVAGDSTRPLDIHQEPDRNNQGTKP